MTMSKTPLKILHHTAKITNSKVAAAKKDFQKWETDKARAKLVTYTMPSGKQISGEGLPDGLETEKLDAILTELKSKALVKHTTRQGNSFCLLACYAIIGLLNHAD